MMIFSDVDLEEVCQAQEDYDSKCDYCNCALNDCSLCGVSSFDEDSNGVPIC